MASIAMLVRIRNVKELNTRALFFVRSRLAVFNGRLTVVFKLIILPRVCSNGNIVNVCVPVSLKQLLRLLSCKRARQVIENFQVTPGCSVDIFFGHRVGNIFFPTLYIAILCNAVRRPLISACLIARNFIPISVIKVETYVFIELIITIPRAVLNMHIAPTIDPTNHFAVR